MKRAAVVALSVALCASAAASEENCTTTGNVTNCQTPGNLKATQSPGCISLTETDATMAPPDLALSVLSCRDAGRTRDETELFALMMMRGYFDAYRVTDESARQAVTVLRIELSQRLGPEADAALTADLKRLLNDAQSPEFKDFCARFSQLPVPSYSPDYMVAHGMNAVLGKADQPALKEIDAAASWSSIIGQGLKCPSGN